MRSETPAETLPQTWQSEASTYFTRLNNWALPSPLDTCFISERHRVLYTPIAKCACTSLKTMMVKLQGANHAEDILRLGVHRVTDVFNTGMLLKNLPLARALAIVEADDYFKFAVVRNPIGRAISAYTEKFVVKRMAPENHLHTYQVVRAIQSGSEPDMDRGITFRQFVEFLVSQEPDTLDAHWLPQHLNLRGIPRYDRVFAFEKLDQLKSALEDWTGTTVHLDELNVSSSAGDAAQADAGSAVDRLPAELMAAGRLSQQLFKERSLIAALERFYAEDCALYRQALETGGSYRPATSLDLRSLKARGDNFATSGEVRILSDVHVFSKGLLGLRADGSGSIGIAIVNGSAIAINQSILPGLRLEYQVIGQDGQPLEPAPAAYPLQATVPAGQALRLGVQLKLPVAWLERAAKIRIVLTSAVDGEGGHERLANIACADIVRTAG